MFNVDKKDFISGKNLLSSSVVKDIIVGPAPLKKVPIQGVQVIENNIPNKTGKSTVRNLGCVYTAEIRNDFEKAQTLLRENGINYISGAGGMRYEHKSD